MSNKPPLISFIGWSGSGKTTFFEQVVRNLSADEVKVGLIKHISFDTQLDTPGKDSWRYEQAGASPVIAASEHQYAVFRSIHEERTLAPMADDIAAECDVILAEGHRVQASSVIEFRRMTHKKHDPIFDLERLTAIVCDDASVRDEASRLGVPAFDLDDTEAVAEFIEEVIRSGLCTNW